MKGQEPIFHIAERRAWEQSLALGRYEAASLGREGFIHCSTQAQVIETANSYYRGRADLCLFVIDPTRLRVPLHYEPPVSPAGEGASRTGEGLFPHVYGALEPTTLARVLEFDPRPDGSFALPEWHADATDQAREPVENLVQGDPRVQGYWAEFCRACGVADATPYQAYYFGDSDELAHELVELVVTGDKRATTTLLWSVERYPALAPVAHGYGVLTEHDGSPRAVVRTRSLEVCAFDQVDAQYAWEEGEGDRSLATWRADHWEFFSRECALLGRAPRPEMRVILERFELLLA